MKTRAHHRILSLFLILYSVLIPFAVRASAAGSSPVTFSSFEQLQELSEKAYTDITWATYTGTEPLIILEDLTLPHHLYLDTGDVPVSIPADVELVSTSPDFSGCLYVNDIRISGALTCDSLYVQDRLMIDGSLKTNNRICLAGTTEVTGASRILYGQDWSSVSCWYSIGSFSQLKEAIATATNTTDSHWNFHLNLHQKDIHISESISIPDDCELYIDQTKSPLKVTIAPDCILDLNCRTWVYSSLEIQGTLINRGELNICYPEGGRLILAEDGTYLSEGLIHLYGILSADKKDALPGFVLSDFNETAFHTPMAYLELQDPCLHKIADFAELITEPTCSTGGYTIYACEKCSDHYIANKTKPTGQHAYTDETDAACNTCGALREIQEHSAPLFRLYNPYTLEHLFSSSPEERDLLAAAGWIFEGIAWKVPDSGDPVYRLYNPYDDSHFYTVSEEEIETLLPLGWKMDGIMCYSADAKSGTPIRRLFNPYEAKNYHLYTVSQEECDLLVPLGWMLEGIAWHGITD